MDKRTLQGRNKKKYRWWWVDRIKKAESVIIVVELGRKLKLLIE